MKKIKGFERGMGIGGWLTNYKRFHVIEKNKVNILTIGDKEHFQTYISESDVANIANMGFDHIRVCFDQVVLEDGKGGYIDEHFELIKKFVLWCEKYNLNVVLNLHKAVGNYCDVDTGVSLFEDIDLQANFTALWVEIEKRLNTFKGVAFELLNEVKDVISILKEYEIPYSVWNYLSAPYDGNRFSLVDDETRNILSEELKEVLLGNF